MLKNIVFVMLALAWLAFAVCYGDPRDPIRF